MVSPYVHARGKNVWRTLIWRLDGKLPNFPAIQYNIGNSEAILYVQLVSNYKFWVKVAVSWEW